MKSILFTFAVTALLMLAASSDACLGQRSGLRSRLADRRSSRQQAVQQVQVQTVQTVTTVRVQSFATSSCSSATMAPLFRRASGCAGAVRASSGCAGSSMKATGCASSIRMVPAASSGCSSGYIAPALPSSKK